MKSVKGILASYVFLGIAMPTLCFAACPQVSWDTSEKAIAERTAPFGTVDVEGGGAKPAVGEVITLSANAGEERYKSTCAVCHATGVAGAPKFRDATDWKPRMAAGMDTMLAIAKKGKGAMPPMGTCMQCSDEELRKTIEYMLPQ